MKKLKYIFIILSILILITIILYSLNIVNKKQYTSKEDITALIEKGLKSSSQVNIFILTRESLEDEYTKILNEGNYRELIGILDLSKYKNEKIEFVFLEQTDNCVLGYFLEKDNHINGTTYIRINKTTGELEDLDNNLLKATIYK